MRRVTDVDVERLFIALSEGAAQSRFPEGVSRLIDELYGTYETTGDLSPHQRQLMADIYAEWG